MITDIVPATTPNIIVLNSKPFRNSIANILSNTKNVQITPQNASGDVGLITNIPRMPAIDKAYDPRTRENIVDFVPNNAALPGNRTSRIEGLIMERIPHMTLYSMIAEIQIQGKSIFLKDFFKMNNFTVTLRFQ